MNQKRNISIILFVIILSFTIITDAKIVKSARSNGQYKAQTIPTRTPIPPPATATKSNGGNNNPTATNTPQTQASPTSTLLSVTFAPTPVGGFIATAVPCSSNPTIQTLGATNVRSGPNIEYEVVGELVYLEVRHIVGRAETAAWWLIQFNDGQSGWVADEIVLVQGYTPIIPIVAAPPLAGGTPTPASAWNPTPIPFCTVTPVPTAVPSPTPTAEPVEVSPVEVSSTETPLPTEPPPTEVRPTETAIVQPTAVPINPTVPLATAVSTPPEEDGNSSIGIILLAIGLLGVGALVLFFLRRR